MIFIFMQYWWFMLTIDNIDECEHNAQNTWYTMNAHARIHEKTRNAIYLFAILMILLIDKIDDFAYIEMLIIVWYKCHSVARLNQWWKCNNVIHLQYWWFIRCGTRVHMQRGPRSESCLPKIKQNGNRKCSHSSNAILLSASCSANSCCMLTNNAATSRQSVSTWTLLSCIRCASAWC